MISLIMPTYNKPERLKITLTSVLNLNLDSPIEIIIIDDGSTDDTQKVLKEFKKKVRKNKCIILEIYHTNNNGRSVARNYGIHNAKGEILIFIDDDLVLHQDFVKNHVKYHTEKNLVVHGKIMSLPYLKFFKDPVKGTLINNKKYLGPLESVLIDYEEIKKNIYNSVYRKCRLSKFENDIKNLYAETTLNDTYVRWIGFVGGNVSVRKESLTKIGAFDPLLGYKWGCEDLELGYRLYKEGLRFIYSENAINYHMDHYRANIDFLHKEAFEYFISKHSDLSIELLYDYFVGKTSDLVQWRDKIKKEVNYV